MIVYFDTSAVLPLLIEERGSVLAGRLWESADRRVSSRLTYVETAAALAMAQRLGRVSEDERAASWSTFVDIWPDVDVVELTPEIAALAAELAAELGLRGYDAVQCAIAVAMNDADLVAATGDCRVFDAWRALQTAVVDTNQVVPE